MQSKFFAYYITENQPIILENIDINIIKKIFTGEFSNNEELIKENNKLYNNLFECEWPFIVSKELLLKNKDSIVLVKMTLVNEMFCKESTDTDISVLNDFIDISTISIPKNSKFNLCNVGDSKYKKTITFSGTQEKSYLKIKDSLEYVFIEKIIINMSFILNAVSYIEFDTKYKELNEPDKNTFDKTINSFLEGSNVDNFVINLLIIFNAIVKEMPVINIPDLRGKNPWKILHGFVPLLDTTKSDVINNVWNELINYNENNMLYFLHDFPSNLHNTFIYDKINKTNKTNKTNTDENIYKSVNYPMKYEYYTRLNITKKKWDNISYIDALPFSSCFTIYEYNSLNSSKNYVNLIYEQRQLTSKKQSIEYRTRKTNYIHSTNEQKENDKKLLESIQKSLNVVSDKITSKIRIEPYFKEHISYNTPIGIFTNIKDLAINTSTFNFETLYYMRSILTRYSNALYHSSTFTGIDKMFRYRLVCETEKNISKYELDTYDIIKFYIHKDVLQNILTSKINVELITFNDFFKLQITDNFDDSNFDVINYKCNSEISYIDTNISQNSINTLDNFLNSNLAVKLIKHQKNNLLWLLKKEDDIDNNKLYINSIKYDLHNHLNFSSNDFDIIRNYIWNLRISIPTKITNIYCAKINNNDYIINLVNDNLLQKNSNILMQLYEIKYFNIYSHKSKVSDTNIIQNIITKNNYNKKNICKLELCGGSICDEVGLGKTLSIISNIIVKFKNDMKKYDIYKSLLSRTAKELRKKLTDIKNPNDIIYTNPLENGFEYNNLIIVPSRLTSQWETEIQKYCKDKFNINVKVLASINSIKQLERELNEFFTFLDTGNIKNVQEYRNLKSTKINKKNNSTKIESTNEEQPQLVVETPISIQPTVENILQNPIIITSNFNEPEIHIQEIENSKPSIFLNTDISNVKQKYTITKKKGTKNYRQINETSQKKSTIYKYRYK